MEREQSMNLTINHSSSLHSRVHRKQFKNQANPKKVYLFTTGANFLWTDPRGWVRSCPAG